MPESSKPEARTARIDHVPAMWIEPEPGTSPRKLVIWLPYFTGGKESVEPQLRELAARGFFALSFDPWQHGQRAVEAPDALQARVFGNFQRFMWPIFAHTALDVLRVIDWAIERWSVDREIRIGGISMGGDVAVAAAGIDPRIKCAAVIAATLDWLRLGMDLPPGKADAYSQFFYDHWNPLTHPDHYRHCPSITFECGAEDHHVPPDGAMRFQSALRDIYRSCPDRLRVTLHPGAGHTTTDAMWRNCLDWICAH
jgi:dienelactone hydrolase